MIFSFTFHYVSINIMGRIGRYGWKCHFTFHYVSINIKMFSLLFCQQVHFTFHYVSINIRMRKKDEILVQSLHSTMYLLICAKIRLLPNTHSPLHSTMYLLILYVRILCRYPDKLYIPLCIY